MKYRFRAKWGNFPEGYEVEEHPIHGLLHYRKDGFIDGTMAGQYIIDAIIAGIIEEVVQLYPIRDIPIGTKVRVLRKAERGEQGWNSVWVNNMNEYTGCIGTTSTPDSAHGVKVEFDDDGWYFPSFILEVIPKPQILWKHGDTIFKTGVTITLNTSRDIEGYNEFLIPVPSLNFGWFTQAQLEQDGWKCIE